MAPINAELMKKLASNPRFRAAEKSGRAYVIPGAKPGGPAQDCHQLPQNQLKHPGPNNAPASSAWATRAGRCPSKCEPLHIRTAKNVRAPSCQDEG